MTQKLFVNITKGWHRNKHVKGVYPVIKPFKEAMGKTDGSGFVTIATEIVHPFRTQKPRITVLPGDFEYQDFDGKVVKLEDHLKAGRAPDSEVSKLLDATNFEETYIKNESEEEAMDRIKETFAMLDEVVDAGIVGIIRGLVVSGPPGVGKSFGVMELLKKANMMRVLAGQEPQYEFVTGAASPIGLYQKLYFNRQKGMVTVFDDCDSVLFEPDSLNLLKAALDSGNKRRLCWNFESRVLNSEDIPNAFDFEGSIIFLTNVDFENVREGRTKDHLQAIMSRCHYLDLEISNQRDKILRIKQIVRDGMLDEYNFEEGADADTIIEYIEDNADHMRELSLRMVKKLADFVKMKPGGWMRFAEATCLTREAKFKRLMQEKIDPEAIKQEMRKSAEDIEAEGDGTVSLVKAEAPE